MLTRITAAVEAARLDPQAGRDRLGELWNEAAGDPFHRCTIAHYLADLQDETEDELTWDLRALEAANAVTDEQVRQIDHSLQVESLLPSLHLNLADDYRRLGLPDEARHHLETASAHLGVLASDASSSNDTNASYGALIRGALDRVATALAEGSTARLETNPST
ncbi:hypothetical protein [Kribbella deserti]|uniref:Tetratricopeptide repeat protein n=1 Tax=Kribbella deserti TaxID=1926257 RepID=A0ABV6QQ02_9ACTN